MLQKFKTSFEQLKATNTQNCCVYRISTTDEYFNNRNILYPFPYIFFLYFLCLRFPHENVSSNSRRLLAYPGRYFSPYIIRRRQGERRALRALRLMCFKSKTRMRMPLHSECKLRPYTIPKKEKKKMLPSRQTKPISYAT